MLLDFYLLFALSNIIRTRIREKYAAGTVIVKEILKYTETISRDNKQYGFLSGRNTIDALIQVIEDWNRATDEGRTTHVVFFDFK